MENRRSWKNLISVIAGIFLLGSLSSAMAEPLPGGTLEPGDVDKFVTPLIIPPAMPGKMMKKKDLYVIGVRQFDQQILPPVAHPPTTVWSYGSVNNPETFNYPAFTIEAKYDKPVEVVWRNQLIDEMGNYLPHLLPVDPTLHWANPPGGYLERDMRPIFTSTPGSYDGPVPLSTHVHGAHTWEDSDGYAEAWYLPDANNIPEGYARTGTFYDYFNAKYDHGWEYGEARFTYPNDQRATTLWYHDHTLGMTRVNVYAGPAGFYLIRGGPDDEVIDGIDSSSAVLPGPAPGVGDSPFDPTGAHYGEIPIAIQDRSFDTDGSLFYPATREFFDGYAGPFIPDTTVSPIWNPEFFGNMMVVNGRTWPYQVVEQRRYRLRLLNGCNSRFLVLKLTTAPRTDNESLNDSDASFWQIGAEGGFLNEAAVELDQLLMGPAERADVIVDFSEFAVGDEVYLVNDGPDAPFGGEISTEDISDYASTGKVMQFRVVEFKGDDPTTPPEDLVLPTIYPLGASSNTQLLSLNEEMLDEEYPTAALLGTWTLADGSTPLLWMNDITENPALGALETWEIRNFTGDAHPIHLHQVQFQVVNRQAIDEETGETEGVERDPEAWEMGWKDTVIAYPGEVTRIKAEFDLPGFYVWHCHIVEHEDNEMMRPFHVGAIPYDAPAH